jgi:SanA protein
MRLGLYVVLGLGAVVLGLVLLGWLAERKMERKAAADSTSDIARVHALKVALVLGTAPIGPEGGPNRYLVYRLDAAAELWKAGKVKYLLVSGNRDGSYDEPTAMREGLIKRGVPAEAIYRDFAGYRTRDSVLRACDVFGQAEILVVSQRFHGGRALFIAHHEGIHAWGYDARDIDQPYSIVTPLRRYPSALMAYVDMCLKRPASEGGAPVAIGVDPPN